jgi:hypothetical protein
MLNDEVIGNYLAYESDNVLMWGRIERVQKYGRMGGSGVSVTLSGFKQARNFNKKGEFKVEDYPKEYKVLDSKLIEDNKNAKIIDLKKVNCFDNDADLVFYLLGDEVGDSVKSAYALGFEDIMENR